MDIWEFLARSEWPALAGAVVWLLHRPLKRMAEDVIPKTVELLGAKVELEKRLSALEAYAEEQRKLEADPKVHARLARGARKAVSDAWQRLEAKRRHFSGELPEEDARALMQLQQWKDEFLNDRAEFTYDEVFRFKEDAEQLMARMGGMPPAP
jgi:hypothetical protein